VKASFEEKGANDLRRVAEYAFTVVGVVALAYCMTVSVDARLFQKREAQRLAREVQAHAAPKEKDASPGSNAEQPIPPEGAVVAGLTIPRLGLSTVVVEGIADSDLKKAPGHIPGTALPGEPGNVGIAGHRDTFFRPLRLIQKGDLIALTTPREEDWYRVVSTRVVSPDDVQVLSQTSHDTLTLVTCYPFYYVGSAPERFIVRAQRSDSRD
jgi:sortase A